MITRTPRRRAKLSCAALCATTLVALTACAGGGEAAQSAQSPSEQTLSVWVRAADDSQKAYQMIFDKFTAETGIKIKMFATLTDFETKLNAAAAGRQLPDVVVNDAAQLGAFADAGIIREVDRDSVAAQEDLTEAAWKSAQDVDGKYLAVPFSAQANLLFIRTDWLTKLGLQPPTTWAEMVEVATAFTSGDPDGNGLADTYGLGVPGSTTRGYISWNWSSYLWQNGGEFIDDSDGKLTSAINSPEAVEAAQWYEDLFCTSKVVQPGALNAASLDSNKAWQTGVVGMYLTGPYAFATSDATPIKGNYTVVAPPTGPAGDAVLAEGTNIYLMAGTKLEEASQQLAEFMITPETQEIGMVGVPAASIVRLPVNSTVDAAAVHDGDPRWKVAQSVYESSAHYEPVSIPQWQELRQSASDVLNSVISQCGDPQVALDELDAKYDSILAGQ